MPEEVKKSLIGDLAGLSEPLKKLLEVVSSGVGRLTGSMWLEKRDADNEAYKILKVGSAQTQVAVDRMKAVAAIGSGSTPHVQKLTLTGNEVNAELSDGQQAVLALKERGNNRAEYQNLLHQLNIEQTISFAAEELTKDEETEVSSEPVDENWINRYFSIIQDVSGEELQALWGKVLAGEIKKPSSFSLRTLDVIRNLNQDEAELFVKACKYLIVTKGSNSLNYSFYRNEIDSGIFDDLKFDQIMTLMDCGLIKPIDTAGIEIKVVEEGVDIAWQVADKIVKIKSEANVRTGATVEFQTYILSNAGSEISSLIEVETSTEYLLAIARRFKSISATISYGKFGRWLDNGNLTIKGSLTTLAVE